MLAFVLVLTLTAGTVMVAAMVVVRLVGIILSMVVNVLVPLTRPVLRTSCRFVLLWFRIPQLLNRRIDRGARFRRVTIGTFVSASSLMRGSICLLFLSPIVRVLVLPTKWAVAVRVRRGDRRQELNGRLVMITVWWDLWIIVVIRGTSLLMAIGTAELRLQIITVVELLISTMGTLVLLNRSVANVLQVATTGYPLLCLPVVVRLSAAMC